MTSQQDLFSDYAASLPKVKIYPDRAGSKTGGTSREAADRIESAGRAEILRNRVLQLLKTGRQLTADEIADELDESPLSIRPRVTELKAKSLIEKTGERRANRSGADAYVWRAAVLNSEQA